MAVGKEEGANKGDSPQLLLSTWLIMYLRGDLPGGLPNDFLSRGTSTLLVFDKILCDRDALKAKKDLRAPG